MMGPLRPPSGQQVSGARSALPRSTLDGLSAMMHPKPAQPVR